MGIIQSIIQKKEMKQPEKMEIEGSKEEEVEAYFVPHKLYCGNPFPPPDCCHAISIVIDGPSLKLYDEATYNYLLDFALMARRFSYLHLFRHKGNGKNVKSYTGEELQRIDAFHHSATTAINQYNNLTKKQLLKLEKLLKVNSVYRGGPLLYMTFSAIDMDSASSAEYNATIVELRGQQLLALLMLPSPDNINKNLAILSISGMIH
ncbi:uncharacterized protein LOC141622021 [Silene latifolia]|uniref:uncharacterized protein LOC141622021 n=1 Tax=Silene latifolia TaxID=37657 RepID=UPI003D76C647